MSNFEVLLSIILVSHVIVFTFACKQLVCEDKEINPAIPNPCTEQFEILTDLTHADFEEDYFYSENANCFHKCFPGFLEKCLNVACDPVKCPPGYYCPNQNGVGSEQCKVDENSCFKHYLDGTNKQWKPICRSDGTWEPKQCKGEKHNGRCFCFDEVGNRIFGDAFERGSQNMTCACSRRRVELMNTGSRFYATLHCDTMGNYEPLQCDNEQCWCVEPQTGKITANVVPEKMMKHLPCYSKEKVGERYLRQCESEQYAQKKVLYELSVHGTQYANFLHLTCDFDGTYGAYQIESGRVNCKWKDNSNIGSWGSETVNGLNCNCARDKKLYELSGMAHTLMCDENGNYRQYQQQTNGQWFCVDSDGFRNSEFSDKPITSCPENVR